MLSGDQDRSAMICSCPLSVRTNFPSSITNMWRCIADPTARYPPLGDQDRAPIGNEPSSIVPISTGSIGTDLEVGCPSGCIASRRGPSGIVVLFRSVCGAGEASSVGSYWAGAGAANMVGSYDAGTGEASMVDGYGEASIVDSYEVGLVDGYEVDTGEASIVGSYKVGPVDGYEVGVVGIDVEDIVGMVNTSDV